MTDDTRVAESEFLDETPRYGVDRADERTRRGASYGGSPATMQYAKIFLFFIKTAYFTIKCFALTSLALIVLDATLNFAENGFSSDSGGNVDGKTQEAVSSENKDWLTEAEDWLVSIIKK